MEERMEYIEELMIARLSGNIAQKDLDFLNEMIGADAEVAKLWQEHLTIHSQLKEPEDKETAWNNIQTGIKEKQQQKHKRKWQVPVLATLAIVVVVTGTLVFVKRKTVSLNEPVTVAAVNRTIGNKIKFTTGNESVTIDRNNTVPINIGAAEIINQNGALVFNAKAASSAISTLEVPQGLDHTILLSDNTKVWVNAASKISFPLTFTGNNREVTLEGEAYFEVEKNKAKPFIVHTKGMDVQVFGTHFNIKAYEGEPTQTSLTEGSVQASHHSQKMMLVPGKAAIADGDILSQKPFDETTILAWMKGAYYFDDEMLESISHTVDRWFGYNFNYADVSIRAIKFSGALEKSQTLEKFLERLCSSANLTYTIAGKEINLEKK